MKHAPPNTPGPARGFTLVEILVAITIILALTALVAVGFRKATLAAHKTASANNIRGLSSLTLATASDHGGRFVGIHSGQGVPFRFSRDFREDNGISRDMVYSAANKCWKPSGFDVCARRELWDYGEGDSVWGYSCLVNDTPLEQDASQTGWADNGTFSPPDKWRIIESRVTTVIDGNPVVRWVPERLGQEVAYPILWMDIFTVWNGALVGNFMKNDREPLGIHVGYLDGHIEWVPAQNMRVRFRSPQSQLSW